MPFGIFHQCVMVCVCMGVRVSVTFRHAILRLGTYECHLVFSSVHNGVFLYGEKGVRNI